jgi:hypothetical protein
LLDFVGDRFTLLIGGVMTIYLALIGGILCTDQSKTWRYANAPTRAHEKA